MIASEVVVGLSYICPWIERVCLHLISLVEEKNAFYGLKIFSSGQECQLQKIINAAIMASIGD